MENKNVQIELDVDALKRCHARLTNAVDNLIVLSPHLKVEIKAHYFTAFGRLSSLSTKQWKSASVEDLYNEHNELVSQLKHLDIFSDKFYEVIYSCWFNMLQVYHDYHHSNK